MITVSEIAHGGTVAGLVPVASVRPSLSAIIEDEAGANFRARLVADENLHAGALSGLPDILRRNGFDYHFADVWQGKQVLVVTELTADTQTKLLRLLQDMKLLQPDAISFNVKSDAELMKENFRRDSVKWAGKFAVTSDMAMIAAGLAQPRKDWGRILNGVGFAGVESLMAIYGNGQGEIDFDKLMRDMNGHFKGNGIDLPLAAKPEEQRSIAGQINDYIKKHTIDIVFGIGMISNLGNIKSGIEEYSRSGGGISRLLYGTGSAATSAGVVMLPEKKKKSMDEVNEPREVSYFLTHPLAVPVALKNFILESPLRFKGIYSTLNSTLHLIDSRGEFRKMKQWVEEGGGTHNNQTYSQKAARFNQIMDMPRPQREQAEIIKEADALRTGMEELKLRETFARTAAGKVSPYLTMAIGVGYLIGSAFIAFSSRHRDRSFEEADEYEKMYALTAQTLLPFPPEQREEMLKQMATYLSTQDDVKAGDIGIEKILQEVGARIDKMEKSPWLPAKGQEQSVSAAAGRTHAGSDLM